MSDAELIDLNRQGIIPGPTENEGHFLTRAAYCMQLKTLCGTPEMTGLPPCEETETSSKLLDEAFYLTRQLYDIEPTWIPIAFSNYRLAPWHGGSAWIFQMESNSPTGAFLQLRQAFRQCKKYLYIYRRDELTAHELAHVGRMQFAEPQFEELLAYRTSHMPWRRWMGPIVQSPWESALFMISVLLILILDIYLQFTVQYETYQLFFWAKAIPLSLLFFGFIRLWHRQRAYKKCLSQLTKAWHDPNKARFIAYRLTDEEIWQFSNLDVDGITAYAERQKAISLRWRLIHLAYL